MLYEIFPATMAQRWFECLLKCLRLENTTANNQRKQVDYFAAVRNIHDQFNENFKKNYVLDDYVTLDEMLLAVQ